MQPDCRQVLDELHIYLDGECGGDLQRAILVHLTTCGPCERRADFEREVRVVLSTACREKAPANLVAQVLAMLNSTSG